MTEPAGTARRPTTPTVQQGHTTTTARPASTPTRQQAGARPGVPTVEQGTAPAGPAFVPGAEPSFPTELAERFEPLEFRGRGSEGAVWRCRRVSEGDEVAVKVNWVGRPMHAELLDHLADPAFRRHVPRIHDHGTFLTPHGEVAWVATEHFGQTLGELVASAPPTPARARELLEELANALDFWQRTVDRNPLDFKPDNLMLRSGKTGQIVIADFGGVSAFTASQQQGGPILAAVAYSPPEEVWQEKRSPWPWWALGEIAYLMITGHTRFQRPNGDMLPDEVIKRIRHVGALDLEDVPDPRWRLLIRGLLTRDSHDRWTAGEVRLWLDGGSPPVAQAAGVAQVRTHRPITFVDGRAFTDPAELAVTMLDNWRHAEEWLTGNGRQELLDWLLKEKLDQRFDTSHLRGLATDEARLHRAVLAFGAAFAPEVTPRVRGRAVDPAGLVAIVGGPDGFRFARELVESRSLGVAGGYRCAHPGCPGPRCAVLDRAAIDVTGLVPAVEDAIAAVAPAAGNAGWGPLADDERDRLYGLALLAVADPASARRLVRRADRWRWGTPRWWRTVRARATAADPGTPAGRVAILTAAVLRERAFAERVGDGVPMRDRLRVDPGRVGRRLGAVAAMFVALVLVAWIVGTLGLAELVFSAEPALAEKARAEAPSYYLALAPALLVLAAEVVLLGRGRAGWLVGGCGLAACLAIVAPRLPVFTAVGVPGPVESLLATIRDAWREDVALGVALFGFVALACFVGAARLLSATVPTGARPRLPGRNPAHRLVVLGVFVVVLPAVLWAAGVVRLTVLPGDTVRYVAAGTQLAYEQAGYLLVFLLAAGIGAAGWPRTRGFLVVAVSAAVALGLWAAPIAELGDLRHPVAVDLFTSIAALWGAGAFWAALLGYLPLAVLGRRLADR
jgi:hypothetical protein